jgi:hypothetical protein
MKGSLSSLKPGVNHRVHLFFAPFLWTGIGFLLIYRGWGYIGLSQQQWLVVVGFVLGTLKSLLIMDRTARRGVERIVRLRDGSCLGAVYSWKTWLLVGLMMASGILIRKWTEPGRLIGTLYVAVGWALLFSSRFGWASWLKEKK